jgi:hypothetical protein
MGFSLTHAITFKLKWLVSESNQRLGKQTGGAESTTTWCSLQSDDRALISLCGCCCKLIWLINNVHLSIPTGRGGGRIRIAGDVWRGISNRVSYEWPINTTIRPACMWKAFLKMVSRLRAERSGARILAGARIFLFSKTSRPALVPTHPSIQWVLGFYPEINRPGRKVNHSHQSSAEAQNKWTCTSTPPICPHSVDSENFTFTYWFVTKLPRQVSKTYCTPPPTNKSLISSSCLLKCSRWLDQCFATSVQHNTVTGSARNCRIYT